jgi:hypothetical protein
VRLQTSSGLCATVGFGKWSSEILAKPAVNYQTRPEKNHGESRVSRLSQGREREKIRSRVPTGPETKNGCAGEASSKLLLCSGPLSVASKWGQQPLSTVAVQRLPVVESRYQATSTRRHSWLKGLECAAQWKCHNCLQLRVIDIQ